MKECRLTVRVSGTGATRERAFAAAMQQIRQEVGRHTEGTCFRVEPQSLDVASAIEHRWTERFLGLLFARKRRRFALTLRVDVRVCALDLDVLDFTVREEQLTPLQHALHMR